MNDLAMPPLPPTARPPVHQQRWSKLWLLFLIPPGMLMAVFVRTCAPVTRIFSGPVDSSLTISRETTFLTEPLTPEGRVDYIGHLNAVRSDGVTPETNAAVPIFEAMGPGILAHEPAYAIQMADAMGVDLAALRTGPTWLPWSAHEKQFSSRRARKGKYSPQEREQRHSEWLAANAPAMERIARGLERPHFYHPIVWRPGPNWMLGNTRFGTYGQISVALRSRAADRRRAGDLASAWDYIRLAHRLARFVERTPGSWRPAFEQGVFTSCAMLLYEDGLDAPLLRKMLADMRALPPKIPLADVFWAERLLALQKLQGWAYGLGYDGKGELRSEPVPGVPWNKVFRRVNRGWDTVGDAFCDASSWSSFCQERVNLRKDPSREPPDMPISFVKDGDSFTPYPHGQPETLLKMYASCAYPLYKQGSRVDLTELWYSQTVTFEVYETAIAARLYAAEHGGYPVSLKALVPEYMPSIPDDSFFGKGPMGYVRYDDGRCLVYSVGRDGKDDKGAWCAKYKSPSFLFVSLTRGSDDIAVLLPSLTREEEE